MSTYYDVIIIGSGAGGGTLFHALAPTGKRILLLERGSYVPREKANWSTSAVNLEKVVRATPIGSGITSPKQMEGAVLSLGKKIKVESSEANLFEITASYGDGGNSDAANAKIAQAVTQKLIDIFREENLSGNRGEMSTSLAFLDQQIADREKDLAAADQKRLAFEAQNPSLAGGAAADRVSWALAALARDTSL